LRRVYGLCQDVLYTYTWWVGCFERLSLTPLRSTVPRDMRSSTAPVVVMKDISVFPLFLFNLLSVVRAQTDAQNFFVNPPLPGPNQAFSANAIWGIGSTQKIKWKTTYENYTINLWQQDLGFEGAAIGPGPTVFCTAIPLSLSRGTEANEFQSKGQL
jgi:hypothetical protein